jgi:TonB family protein
VLRTARLPLAFALLLVAADASASSICRECVLRPLRARAPEVQRCYRELLERRPGAEGRVVLAFVIPADGVVRDVRVTRDELGDATFRACVADRIRGVRYADPPPEPITIHYPIAFRRR